MYSPSYLLRSRNKGCKQDDSLARLATTLFGKNKHEPVMQLLTSHCQTMSVHNYNPKPASKAPPRRVIRSSFFLACFSSLVFFCLLVFVVQAVVFSFLGCSVVVYNSATVSAPSWRFREAARSVSRRRRQIILLL